MVNLLDEDLLRMLEDGQRALRADASAEFSRWLAQDAHKLAVGPGARLQMAAALPQPDRLNFEGFLRWQRTSLHDRVVGRPVRLPDAKQAGRREDRATLAATVADGGDLTEGRLWLARPQDESGAAARAMAMEEWPGRVWVLRLLEAG